jgi:hypothetical protein
LMLPHGVWRWARIDAAGASVTLGRHRSRWGASGIGS